MVAAAASATPMAAAGLRQRRKIVLNTFLLEGFVMG
jgi:hypothetical protein